MLLQTTPITGITEPVIEAYFDTLNAGEFESTARLFAVNGVLNPPFESPVVGQEAIASYLQTEAQDMKIYPRQGSIILLGDNQTQFDVTGNVKTSLFGVNVAWVFILNAAQKIASVEVKLLASLQELAHLQR